MLPIVVVSWSSLFTIVHRITSLLRANRGTKHVRDATALLACCFIVRQTKIQS